MMDGSRSSVRIFVALFCGANSIEPPTASALTAFGDPGRPNGCQHCINRAKATRSQTSGSGSISLDLCIQSPILFLDMSRSVEVLKSNNLQLQPCLQVVVARFHLRNRDLPAHNPSEKLIPHVDQTFSGTFGYFLCLVAVIVCYFYFSHTP